MERKSYQEYWESVRTIAKEKANKKLGFGIRFFAVVVGAVSTAITAILVGGNPKTISVVALITIVVNLIIWITVWIGFFVYYRAKESVAIYNKQVEDNENLLKTTNELNEKINPTNVKLIVVPSSDDYFPIGKVEIHVFNTSKVEFTECKVMLRELYWRMKDNSNIPENVPYSNRQFDKGEYFSGTNKDVIDAEGKAIVYIAEN
jgi:hypothetical protein